MTNTGPVFDETNPPIFIDDVNTLSILFGCTVLTSMSLVVTIVMMMRTCYYSHKDDQKLAHAFGVISMVSSILAYIMFMFGFTSLFNGIDYHKQYRNILDGNDEENTLLFVDFVEVCCNLFIGITKVSLYASLGFGVFLPVFRFVCVSVIWCGSNIMIYID